MTRDQAKVAIGAGSGIAGMAAAMIGLYRALPQPPGVNDIPGRLAVALQADALAAVPLLLMIIAVANERFLSPAIDPTLGQESARMTINGRVADNTLQQFVLFLVATLALAATLPGDQMRAIPAAAIVFLVARFAFWIGYRIHPLYRAFGMAATSYLNLGLLGAALWRAFRYGWLAF